MMAPAKATLLTEARRLVGPKFEAYFSFTGALCRSVRLPQGVYRYPDASMISDLNFLWSVFADVYQVADEQGECLASLVDSYPFLKQQFHGILEGGRPQHPDGEFWHAPKGQCLRSVPRPEALDTGLKEVLRTLRNGFAHVHWLYDDLSALEYWKKRGWDINAPPDFNLRGRPQKNYMMYIADAKKLEPRSFWTSENLRILITPAAILRYHLHLFLAFLLTGMKVDVFGKSVTS
jgi:hypothetical protein